MKLNTVGRFAFRQKVEEAGFGVVTFLCQDPFFHFVRLLLCLFMSAHNKAEEVLNQ